MISFSHSESFSVTPEGRAIALYLADQWRQQGKPVSTHETTDAITVSYTIFNTLATMDELLAIGNTNINKEGK